MAQIETVPLTSGQPVGKIADPCVMVIFGASGDLTRRKLIPALYNLAKAQLLSREFAVVGISRSPMSSEDYRKRVSEDMKKFATADVDPDLWEWFERRIFYMSGNFDEKETYGRIKEQLTKIDQDLSTQGNYFYYLATTPDAFGPIVESLAEAGLMHQEGGHWRRVIIEKPFGHDVESARALNQQLLKVADEKQIYRIDHYLGKGNRPEHPGVSFRQWHLRAHLEPPLHRPHPDIRCRDGRRGKARRLLRHRRRPARYGSQPHHAAHHPDRDGSHRFPFVRMPCATSSRRSCTPFRPLSAEDVLTRTVRGQYGEGVSDGQRVPAYRAESKVPLIRRPRPSSL